MIKFKTIRNWAFAAHRYLGLALGLLLAIISLTGGLLVFSHEVDAWIEHQQFAVMPHQGEIMAIDTVISTARAAYPQWKIDELSFPIDDRHPFTLRAVTPDSKDGEIYLHGIYKVYVNSYTGAVMGDRAERFTVYRFLLNLHYRLFLEETGNRITYVAAILLLTISIAGTILWPGWRKLSTGFKIKWNAHIKRRNFDIHKVTGIISSTFLILLAVTGIALFHHDQIDVLIQRLVPSQPAIAETSTPTLSQPRPGQAAITFGAAVAQARTAMPSLEVSSVGFSPAEQLPFEIYGKSKEVVYVDPYTAKVLKIKMPPTIAPPLADRFSQSIVDIHFGKFGGLTTRIIYVFVGFSPAILFITGFIMWKNRKPANRSPDEPQLKA